MNAATTSCRLPMLITVAIPKYKLPSDVPVITLSQGAKAAQKLTPNAFGLLYFVVGHTALITGP